MKRLLCQGIIRSFKIACIKNMGVLVHTTFQTPEGVDLQSVYLKITSFTCDVIDNAVRVCIRSETYIDRNKRLAGFRPVGVPNVPLYTTFQASSPSDWNSIASLYSHVKSGLVSAGFTVEDILEDGQQSSA